MTDQPGGTAPMRDGTWYQASDGNFYCWPNPTPYTHPPVPLATPTSRPLTYSTPPSRRNGLRNALAATTALLLTLGVGGYFVHSSRSTRHEPARAVSATSAPSATSAHVEPLGDSTNTEAVAEVLAAVDEALLPLVRLSVATPVVDPSLDEFLSFTTACTTAFSGVVEAVGRLTELTAPGGPGGGAVVVAAMDAVGRLVSISGGLCRGGATFASALDQARARLDGAIRAAYLPELKTLCHTVGEPILTAVRAGTVLPLTGARLVADTSTTGRRYFVAGKLGRSTAVFALDGLTSTSSVLPANASAERQSTFGETAGHPYVVPVQPDHAVTARECVAGRRDALWGITPPGTLRARVDDAIERVLDSTYLAGHLSLSFSDDRGVGGQMARLAEQAAGSIDPPPVGLPAAVAGTAAQRLRALSKRTREVFECIARTQSQTCDDAQPTLSALAADVGRSLRALQPYSSLTLAYIRSAVTPAA